MPIPELELARVKRALDKFCDRIPLHVRQELTNLYRFKGNSVILIERRPYFLDRVTPSINSPNSSITNGSAAGRCAGATATVAGTPMMDSRMCHTFATSSPKSLPIRQASSLDKASPKCLHEAGRFARTRVDGSERIEAT